MEAATVSPEAGRKAHRAFLTRAKLQRKRALSPNFNSWWLSGAENIFNGLYFFQHKNAYVIIKSLTFLEGMHVSQHFMPEIIYLSTSRVGK